jgi:alpha-D-ribose 1-methylphosphonate 5-phosphate C-P lyase
LFGAGREKRIYAIPPHTSVVSLDFEDHPFERYRHEGACSLCGSSDSFLDEVIVDDRGQRMLVCSDTDYCERRRAAAREPSAAGPEREHA